MTTPSRHHGSSRGASLLKTFSLALLVGLPTTVRAQVLDSTSVATTIHALERDWAAALVVPDTVRLLRIISPEFALMRTGATETLRTRVQWFSDLRQNHPAAFSARQITVRVFARRPPWHQWADMAISTFLADERTVASGSERRATVFVTDVWRLNGARWHAVARYVTVPAADATGRTAP
jgi:hypothetical protein